MRKIIGLLLALAPLALLETRNVGATTEPPAPSDTSQLSAPPFAGVKGAFFALSVADIEDSAKWYAEKLGLAVEMRTRFGKTSVIVLSGNGLTVELLGHDDAAALDKDTVLVHGFIKAGLVVENLDKTLAELKARNVPIAFGPYPAKPNAMANFIIHDNAGNLIQFFGK
jgi:catechol 2,3-dioxygenase-like lactoylglutathione lyase family enzyme